MYNSKMENWKPVVGYEGIYEVSDQGQVRRIKPEKNTHVGRILIGAIDRDGYRVVLLYRDGKRKMFKVHRLVGLAFIPNPGNKPQINHKNTIKLDNRSENLEWSSSKENINHAVDNNLWNAAKGSKHGHSKLTEFDVIMIRELDRLGYAVNELGKQFKVSDSTVSDVLERRTWAWL